MTFLTESKLLTIGGKTINVKVLTSEEDKTRGYQFQKKVPDFNQGLLFVFNSPRSHSFHMNHVYFDLELLSFDSRGVFIGIQPMEAGSGPEGKTRGAYRAYQTPSNTMYVIECQPGWSSHLKRGVSRLKF